MKNGDCVSATPFINKNTTNFNRKLVVLFRPNLIEICTNMYAQFRGTKVAEILTNHFDEIERVLLRGIGCGEKSQGFVEKKSNLF